MKVNLLNLLLRATKLKLGMSGSAKQGKPSFQHTLKAKIDQALRAEKQITQTGKPSRLQPSEKLQPARHSVTMPETPLEKSLKQPGAQQPTPIRSKHAASLVRAAKEGAYPKATHANSPEQVTALKKTDPLLGAASDRPNAVSNKAPVNYGFSESEHKSDDSVARSLMDEGKDEAVAENPTSKKERRGKASSSSESNIPTIMAKASQSAPDPMQRVVVGDLLKQPVVQLHAFKSNSESVASEIETQYRDPKLSKHTITLHSKNTSPDSELTEASNVRKAASKHRRQVVPPVTQDHGISSSIIGFVFGKSKPSSIQQYRVPQVVDRGSRNRAASGSKAETASVIPSPGISDHVPELKQSQRPSAVRDGINSQLSNLSTTTSSIDALPQPRKAENLESGKRAFISERHPAAKSRVKWSVSSKQSEVGASATKSTQENSSAEQTVTLPSRASRVNGSDLPTQRTRTKRSQVTVQTQIRKTSFGRNRQHLSGHPEQGAGPRIHSDNNPSAPRAIRGSRAASEEISLSRDAGNLSAVKANSATTRRSGAADTNAVIPDLEVAKPETRNQSRSHPSSVKTPEPKVQGSILSRISDFWRVHLAPVGKQIVRAFSPAGAVRSLPNAFPKSEHSSTQAHSAAPRTAKTSPSTRPSPLAAEPSKPSPQTNNPSANRIPYLKSTPRGTDRSESLSSRTNSVRQDRIAPPQATSKLKNTVLPDTEVAMTPEPRFQTGTAKQETTTMNLTQADKPKSKQAEPAKAPVLPLKSSSTSRGSSVHVQIQTEPHGSVNQQSDSASDIGKRNETGIKTSALQRSSSTPAHKAVMQSPEGMRIDQADHPQPSAATNEDPAPPTRTTLATEPEAYSKVKTRIRNLWGVTFGGVTEKKNTGRPANEIVGRRIEAKNQNEETDLSASKSIQREVVASKTSRAGKLSQAPESGKPPLLYENLSQARNVNDRPVATLPMIGKQAAPAKAPVRETKIESRPPLQSSRGSTGGSANVVSRDGERAHPKKRPADVSKASAKAKPVFNPPISATAHRENLIPRGAQVSAQTQLPESAVRRGQVGAEPAVKAFKHASSRISQTVVESKPMQHPRNSAIQQPQSVNKEHTSATDNVPIPQRSRVIPSTSNGESGAELRVAQQHTEINDFSSDTRIGIRKSQESRALPSSPDVAHTRHNSVPRRIVSKKVSQQGNPEDRKERPPHILTPGRGHSGESARSAGSLQLLNGQRSIANDSSLQTGPSQEAALPLAAPISKVATQSNHGTRPRSEQLNSEPATVRSSQDDPKSKPSTTHRKTTGRQNQVKTIDLISDPADSLHRAAENPTVSGQASSTVKPGQNNQAAAVSVSAESAYSSKTRDGRLNVKPSTINAPSAKRVESSTQNQDSDISNANQENENQPSTNAQRSGENVNEIATAQKSSQPAYSPKLTTEQIRELQALVQKALESSRVQPKEGNEASFEWRQKDLGTLRFSITTDESNVRISILSDRPEVADALNRGRAVIERMITDQGMRVEQFDVLVRTAGGEEGRPQTTPDNRSSQARNQTAERDREADSQQDSAARDDRFPSRKRWLGDREWVA